VRRHRSVRELHRIRGYFRCRLQSRTASQTKAATLWKFCGA
jgi:hypothetical protein